MWTPLSFLEWVFIFGTMIVYGVLWFDPLHPSQYFFSQVMPGRVLLGWTDTKRDLICLVCHVCFLQPCDHLLGKGWPLGFYSMWCFLMFLDCIDSWSLPSSLLCSRAQCSSTCEDRTRNTSISTQAVYHWVMLSHMVW